MYRQEQCEARVYGSINYCIKFVGRVTAWHQGSYGLVIDARKGGRIVQREMVVEEINGDRIKKL